MSKKKDDSFEDWTLSSNLSFAIRGSSTAARKNLGNIARQLESGGDLTENTKSFLIDAFLSIENGESADKAFYISTSKVGANKMKNFSRNQFIVIMMNHHVNKEGLSINDAAALVEVDIEKRHPEWPMDADYIRRIYRENK